MKPDSAITRQLTDLVTYLLVPLLALVTPAAFSRAVIRRVSRWNWLLANSAEAALRGARFHVEVTDDHAWRTRWKRVELLDARDIWLLSLGRSKSVLREIDCPRPVETARDRILVGMHWGPGAAILNLLKAEGLKPAIPYRPPEKPLRRSRPFYYLFSKLAARYMRRACGDRAVPVGGAGKVLKGLLDVEGSMVVVSDAPPMEGRPVVELDVLGSAAKFDTGFPRLMANRHREYLLYALNLCPEGSLKKVLEFVGPFTADSAEEYLGNYAAFLDRHLATDSPQWRIWHVQDQFWTTPP